ncbi:hypothetical protein BRD56_02495 [Thermoplasmatales archaeon SW_10_69_26]|nr:MAG: hypothetical protein BRD56_02495 [Thermoplasmatales archaeon SW_10_69_26]
MQLLYEEAKHRVDALSEAISEMDDRIQGIVRFNVLMLGLFVPIVSLFQEAESLGGSPLVRLPMIAGFASMVASTVIGVSAYLKRGTAGGVDAETLAGALDFDVTGDELKAELVRTYRISAAREEELLERTARRFRASLLVLVAGLGFFLVAATTL